MTSSVPHAKLAESLPHAWKSMLKEETQKQYFRDLDAFIENEKEMAGHIVFPPPDCIFNAFRLTPPEKVKALIIGQDPYHDDKQAHGLAFSVPHGTPTPPSLRNILKELHSDLGIPIPSHGCLEHWAAQGVLLLNCVLTVRAHQPTSHSNKGWEQFTDAVIKKIDSEKKNIVFILWGKHAHEKARLVNTSKNHLVTSSHPSPLSARRGFLGSKPFSKTNSILQKHGMQPIKWAIPETSTQFAQAEFSFEFLKSEK